MQNTTGCINITLLDSDDTLLDLNDISKIRIMLFDEYGCPVGNFQYLKDVSSGDEPNTITLLQERSTGDYFTNKGVIKLCFDKESTAITPGIITAEIIITLNNTGEERIIGISCLPILKILYSKIYSYDQNNIDQNTTGQNNT